MATVINNPTPDPTRIVTVGNNDNSGWIIAVIVLVVVIGGLIWYFHYHRTAAAPAQNPPIVNVTIPAPSGDAGASAQGAAPANP